MGTELWRSDGAHDTRLVLDLNPGVASSNPTFLLSVDGVVFFSATDGYRGRELWKTTGETTVDGSSVSLVADIRVGAGGSGGVADRDVGTDTHTHTPIGRCIVGGAGRVICVCA